MYNSPSKTTTEAAVVSGVQRLNVDLASVFDRVQNANLRVADLANQFGAPDKPPVDSLSTEGPVVNTNDHINNVSRALSRLEQTISRIDNQ